jgi:hypothetical protein
MYHLIGSPRKFKATPEYFKCAHRQRYAACSAPAVRYDVTHDEIDRWVNAEIGAQEIYDRIDPPPTDYASRLIELRDRIEANKKVLAVLKSESMTVSTLAQIEADDAEIDTQHSVLRVTARPLSQSGLGEVNMNIQTDADEVAVSGPYVVTTIWGCCVEQPAHEVYSLYSGKRLFSATGPGEFGDWLTMGKKGPTYDQRVVAAHFAITARDRAELSEDENRVAVITYATEAEPLQRLALSAIAMPVTSAPAPRVEDVDQDLAPVHFTRPINFLALCGISLPGGEDGQGRPIGLQLAGAAGQDLALLAVAARAEAALRPEAAASTEQAHA